LPMDVLGANRLQRVVWEWLKASLGRSVERCVRLVLAGNRLRDLEVK